MIVTADMTGKEIINDFKENYGKVRKLLDEESKNDPENEPYLSKYKARGILTTMRDSLRQVMSSESSLDQIKLEAMFGVVLLNIGIIDMETEELTNCEYYLNNAENLLTPNATKPEIVITALNVYNNLGLLWSTREDPEKAKTFLIKAKDLYETFKC